MDKEAVVHMNPVYLQTSSSAPAEAASDLHVDKSDGHLFPSAVTLSADITSSLEKLSCGFGDSCLSF